MFSFLTLIFASAVVFAAEYTLISSCLLDFANKKDAKEVTWGSIVAYFVIALAIGTSFFIGKTVEKEKQHCLLCKAEITEQYNYCPECGYETDFEGE